MFEFNFEIMTHKTLGMNVVKKMKGQAAADGVCLKRLFLSILWLITALPSLPKVFLIIKRFRFNIWSQQEQGF